MFMRSLARHLNSTVYHAPAEVGSDASVSDTGDTDLDVVGSDDAGADQVDDDGGKGSNEDRPLTVREQLKKSIAEVSEDDANKDKREPKKAPRKAAAEKAPVAADAAPAADTAAEIAAPESLSKEAKEAWKDAPLAVKQAFVKREQDMQRGVDELKQRYALIDQAIAPHTDALRQMNATPQEAVDRMFLWFKALAGSPGEAFPQLAKSMGIDWQQLVGGQQQAAPQQQPVNADGTPAAPEIPEPVRNYVGQLENHIKNLTQQVQQNFQQLGGRVESFEQTQQRENMQRTTENLNMWAKDKPHFEEVRQEMAALIQSGMIPLKDGQVDLDTAYERAIHFKPEVRAKVLAAQQQANQQVQLDAAKAATTAVQNKTNQARKAASSLPATNPPGSNQTQGGLKKKPGQKLSVRESLKAAMADLRDQ
jgi:gas vesicle protein